MNCYFMTEPVNGFWNALCTYHMVSRHLFVLLHHQDFDHCAFMLTLVSLELGSEIYVGCDNGELLRFALQASTSEAVRSTWPARYSQY